MCFEEDIFFILPAVSSTIVISTIAPVGTHNLCVQVQKRFPSQWLGRLFSSQNVKLFISSGCVNNEIEGIARLILFIAPNRLTPPPKPIILSYSQKKKKNKEEKGEREKV